MTGCAVVGCANRGHRSKSDSDISVISYHRFPKDETLRNVWIKYCSQKDQINVKNARICSVHFDGSSFVRDLQNELLGKPPRRILKEDAVPTKHVSYSPKHLPSSTNGVKRRQEPGISNYVYIRPKGVLSMGRRHLDGSIIIPGSGAGFCSEHLSSAHFVQDFVSRQLDSRSFERIGTHVSSFNLKKFESAKVEEKNCAVSCKIDLKLFKGMPSSFNSTPLNPSEHNDSTHRDEQKTFNCMQCGKQFSEYRRRNANVEIHSDGKSYECEVCSERFHQTDDLETRVKCSHTVDTVQLCEDCSRKFAQQNRLRTQNYGYSGSHAKPYACLECNKRFLRISHLVTHKRTHSGEKPYECFQCNRKFSELYNLKRHLRSHSGEMPYECVDCGERFARIDNLTIHTRNHHSDKEKLSKECIKKLNQLDYQETHLPSHSVSS